MLKFPNIINFPKIEFSKTSTDRKQEIPSSSRNKKIYDYFSIRIPINFNDKIISSIKDERFVFFIKYGILRRYEKETETIFVEMPQIPGKIVVYRNPIFRIKSFDKFNLDNKDLPHIPLFEGEDYLKYLSLENNQIKKIDQLISLTNLTYLNLTNNCISEIENLFCISKLKILLLGKNFIEKIKNLSSLIKLEVLDLHCNKIKVIEGLSALKQLKTINLCNNQISSFEELSKNFAIEELNLRKNNITDVPNMSKCFQRLRKINLGKNFIDKIESINEFQKLKCLQELIIDNNPVNNNPHIFEFYNYLPIKEKNNNSNSPLLKSVSLSNKQKYILSNISFNKNINNNVLNDKSFYYKKRLKRKISNSMEVNIINSNLNNNTNKNFLSASITNYNFNDYKQNTNTFFKYKKSTHSINSCIFNKEIANNIKKFLNKELANSKNNFYFNKPSLNFILKEKNMEMTNINKIIDSKIKIKNKNDPIKQKTIKEIIELWVYEYENIVYNGFNGYNNKKYREINIDKGYVEIDSEIKLCLYGNCLKILNNSKFYNCITEISFNYFCFNYIMNKKSIEYLLEFKSLNSLNFSNNNIYSLHQLAKLENFQNLEKLNISNNEVCSSEVILKYYLIYKFNNIIYFNRKKIELSERILAKKIFNIFEINNISVNEKKNKSKEKKIDNSCLFRVNNSYNNKMIVSEDKREKHNEKIMILIKKTENLRKLENEMEIEDNENKNKFFSYVKQNLFNALFDIYSVQDDN